MRRIKIILILMIVMATAARADVELLSFRAYALVDHGRIEWSTGEEEAFDAFIVERSADGVSFLAVARVEAEGSFSEYVFTDSSPLDVDTERSFFYRLRLNNEDGSYRYSEVVEVSLNFSAVQQTWGSIKAMFR